MSKITFRLVQAYEVPEALSARVWNLAAATQLYVASVAGEDVALLILDFFGPECHVTEIQVLPAHQRAGVGTVALEFAETTGRARGCEFMRLIAKPLKDRATSAECDELIEWYRARGYVDIQIEDRLLGKKL